ncbi:BlpM [Streptococcus pneumoniae]|nr:bacteriocin [Streptococcus pneumoniae]CVX80471.1 BlpM [Streptococcus pneumoniae]CWF13590.1 BlpM [Streptococcus pneumoniae]
MDTKIMEQFHEMDITMLSSIEGGKNNWQTNVLEGGGAAFGGWGLGTAICAAFGGWGLGTAICAASGVGAPFMGACGYIGAKFGVALWAGVTGATGGF